MKKRILSVSALALAGILMASAVLAAPETFVFDKPHTLVGFRIRHFLSKVEGRFKDFDGVIVLDRQNPAASKVDLTINAASIDTAAENRDKHLRTGDFFEVEKYPQITFKSTKVVPKGPDSYEVTGEFTMHGVTKTITVPVRHTGFLKTAQGEKAGFEINFKLNRKDYGIVWNRAVDSGGYMLDDDVEINVQIEANKKVDDPKPGAAAPAKTSG